MTLTRRAVRRANAWLSPEVEAQLTGEPMPRKRRAHPEQDLQRAVAAYLDWALPAPWWYTAIGHGGGGETRGKILRGMGVKRGIADLLVMGPYKFIHWIELKSLKGSLSAEQVGFRTMVAVFGHYHSVCRSLDEVRNELMALEVPLREVRPEQGMPLFSDAAE